MKIVTAQEMQAIEVQAQKLPGLSSLLMMERAGEALASAVQSLLPVHACRRVAVVCGSGKNGGDGLVCARRLIQAGVETTVWLLRNRRMAPETLKNFKRLPRRSLTLIPQAGGRFPKAWEKLLAASDVVVDALLGTGLSGPPRDLFKQAIEAINASGAAVVSADIPSGLDADSGRPYEPTVCADLTLTFGLPKRGLLRPGAAEFVGRLDVADIGLPEESRAGRDEGWQYAGLADAASWLPCRQANANKRTAGRVLVIGGSAHYHGAPVLAGAGAVRAGAGYVAVAYPKCLDIPMRSHLLEEIALPFANTASGEFSRASLAPLLKAAEGYDALVLGPGMGRGAGVGPWVKDFVRRLRGPRVVLVDADALPAIHGLRLGDSPGVRGRPIFILTPHEGEAANLLGIKAEDITVDRESSVQEIARRYEAVALLKGPLTLVASPQGMGWVAGTGTPALASAGTGDVLAGVIAALAAQKTEPCQAAALGAVLHGLAGRLAATDPGGLGLRARDVAERLPQAIRELRLKKNQQAKLNCF